ncbi:AMP-binding protein, partial [Planctomycetota bacterium]
MFCGATFLPPAVIMRSFLRSVIRRYPSSSNSPTSPLYGMSENCGLTAINPPGATKIGTVGLPLPNCEVKIADDGEILFKGKNTFLG